MRWTAATSPRTLTLRALRLKCSQGPAAHPWECCTPGRDNRRRAAPSKSARKPIATLGRLLPAQSALDSDFRLLGPLLPRDSGTLQFVIWPCSRCLTKLACLADFSMVSAGSSGASMSQSYVSQRSRGVHSKPRSRRTPKAHAEKRRHKTLLHFSSFALDS